MGKMEIPYVEKDGVLYPLLTVPADIELSAVGKYGLLWLSYMKENHKGRFRTLTRLGCVNRTAHKVNEEAYEMLDVIISQHMGKHPPVNPGSTMEMWKLREQARRWRKKPCLRILCISIIRELFLWKVVALLPPFIA